MVDGDLRICCIVAVKYQWKGIGRLNTQQYGTAPRAGYAGNKGRFHLFLFQEIQNEVAHFIVAYARKQCRTEAQPTATRRDIQWRTANKGVKPLDFGKFGSDIL